MTTSPYFPNPEDVLQRRRRADDVMTSHSMRPARRIAIEARRRADRHLGCW